VVPSDPGPAASPPAVPTAEPVCPLTEAHYQMLRQAAAAYRPARKAARTAYVSAATILVVAALAIPFLLVSFSLTNVIIAAALAIIGYLEYSGAVKMRRGEPSAASHLGWNQVIFISLIVLYCVSRMLQASSGEYLTPDVRSQLSQVPGMAASIESLVPLAVYSFYGLIILLSVTFQGSLAWYYFTRRRHLEQLRHSTPAWIRRLFDEFA